MLARASILTNKILLCFCLFLLRTVLSARFQDVNGFINEADIDSIGEITMDDETFLTHIPTGKVLKKTYPWQKTQLSDILGEHNDDYKRFIPYVGNGHALKGLTFNIYNDNMREAVITLFHLISKLEPETLKKVKEWAKENINDHMWDYAERLCTLYGPHTDNFKWKTHEPPFLVKPNFYVNGETIMKALKLKNNFKRFNYQDDKINLYYDTNYQDAKVNQYFKDGKLVSINTNYSGWNVLLEECKDNINYFTEDISLNAYYYGVHLLHPFWMSNNYLDEINSRQAEHYYFSHQQLFARYNLEKEGLKQRNKSINEMCYDNFNSYLVYENGLPFPIRSNIQGEWNQDRAKLTMIDIGLKEFISRGFFIMENGTKHVNLTADNYIGLIAKIIRANYDEVQTAKIIRSLYGYGRNGYPKDSYNPAPSLLHQPETALRDPAYWYLIQYMLNYFNEFEKSLEPLNLQEYDTNSIVIAESNFTKLTTFFDYYQFVIDTAKVESDNKHPQILFAARQRRLNHLPITFDFHVLSKRKQDVTVRLFLGPQCAAENCWENRDKFYQLDIWRTSLEIGLNFVRWSSSMSHTLSSDAVFNEKKSSTHMDTDAYNMFKFPENLLLPKGLEEGLNLTLFIMITPLDESNISPITEGSLYYNVIYYETDEKPLGFPFHRQAINVDRFASNYRFYNVSTFHKKHPLYFNDYFSPNLH